MSYYITEFDIGADLEQPHNFVKINGMSPFLHLSMEYHQQPNYTDLYEWINASDFNLFDSVLTKGEFQANATTVIINSSTAKLKMEFMKKDLFVETDDAKDQLKQSLLMLGPEATQPVHLFNLQNGSGDYFIYFSLIKIKILI